MNKNENQFTNEQHWKLLVSFLREIAITKGIKPYDISKEIGVSPSTVTRIFNLEFCPKLQLFIDIARAVGVNFYFESQEEEGTSDMNRAFEKAMASLGRRIDKLPKN